MFLKSYMDEIVPGSTVPHKSDLEKPNAKYFLIEGRSNKIELLFVFVVDVASLRAKRRTWGQ
jgi:hypothetical protein